MTKKIAIPGKIVEDSMDDFYSEIEVLCRDYKGQLVLDCTDLKNATSNHIGALWQVRQLCDKAGIDILLIGVSRNLVRVLEVLDIADLFKMEVVDDNEITGEFTRTFLLSSDRNFELSFEPTETEIESALKKFLEYMQNFCDNDMCLLEVRTIFYEIATNIRLHGGQGSGNEVKFMAVPGSDDKFIMRFIDSGPPFDPSSQKLLYKPGAAIKRKQKRGFGLIMISRMTDGISYERRNGEVNVLTLEKKWK